MFLTKAINIKGKEFDNSDKVYKAIYEIYTNPLFEIKDKILFYNGSVCYWFHADVYHRNRKIIERESKNKIINYIESKLYKQQKIF